MFSDINEIVNYYLQNPPFEVDEENLPHYQQIIDKSLKQTMLEISENNPIIDEKIFTTPEKTEENKNITDNEHVLVDIYETIDHRFMSFIILIEKQYLPSYLYKLTGRYIPISSSSKNFNLLYLISDESLYVIQEHTWKIIERILIRGRYLKLKPKTEYYTMYKRYRDLNELSPNEQRCFLQLFEINLGLSYYRSFVYTSDNLFRSFSISGLSISLNPPSVSEGTRQLQQLKNQVLNECYDYGDLVERF